VSIFPLLETFLAARAIGVLVPNAFRFLEDRVVLLMVSCDHGAGWMCGGLGWLGYLGIDQLRIS
jgi:hypothetical protein